ncbi:MAG: chromosomal replication initiator protein DnaA, partial [Zetaproteobacteria bacterium]
GTIDGYIDHRFSFENFIVGAGNEFPYAAAKAVAERPGEAYNPLYIYGSVGLGKTHLLQAIANAIVRTKPLRVAYRTGEAFTNELIEAIQTRTPEQFRERYRSVDVLIVDDIQFIAGKERTQEEFFHTFNTLHTQRRQIVLASDRSPSALEHLTDRLRSRFGSGLVADIQPPDFETRMAILKSKTKLAGVEFPEDVLELIASRITSNVRELEGALTRLSAHAVLTREPITVALAKRVIRDLLREPQQVLTIEEIQREVASFFGIPEKEMLSKKRSKNIAFPRQLAMYLAKRLTRYSLPEIGRRFGGRDHTTVLHAVRKIEKAREEDPALDATIERLIAKLEKRS